MMAAIVADPLPGKKKIHLPPGLMYMAGDPWAFGTRKVEVPASVHIEGNGGAGVNASTGLSNSGFLLPQLTQLVFCNQGASSTGTGDAKYSHAEYFNVHTTTPIISTGFARSVYSTMDASFNRSVYSDSGKAVPKGLCVPYSGATVSAEGASKTDSTGTHNNVMFRASTSFVPTGSEPAAFATVGPAQIGTVISDGAGSWTVESVPKDRNIFSGTSAVPGQRLLVPGDVRYIFEVVAGGTLAGDNTGTCGASTTGWLGTGSPYIQPAPWQQFTDGTATVRAMAAGTLLTLANECVYQHLVLEGGIGPSIQVEGGALDGIATPSQPNWAVADYNVVNDVRAFFSHGGVSFHGAECNVGRVNHCRVDTPSSLQRSKPYSIPVGLADMGDGSFCVHQRHLGGNYVTASYYASGLGVGFVSDSSAGSTQPGMPDPIQPGSQTQFHECRVEGTSKPNIVNANALYVTVEAQQGIDDRSAAMQIGPGRSRYIVGRETDANTSKTTNYGLQTGGLSTILSYFLRIGQDATKGAYTGFWTEKVGSLTFQNGWLVYGQGPNSSILGIPRVAWGASFGDAKTTGKLISNFPSGYPNLTFSASAHTITRDTGSWITDGFAIGDPVTVSGSTSNDGIRTITGLTDTVMTFGSGLANEGPRSAVSVYVAGHVSGQGIGLFNILDGYFNRSMSGVAAGAFHATDSSMLDDTRLRYGKRLAGDTFPIPDATSASGTFRRCVVATAGWRAPKWANTLVYVAEDNATYMTEATVVRPSTSPSVLTSGSDRCWKLGILKAQHGGVEPTWPASGNFMDAVGNYWIDMGPTANVQASDPVIDNIQVLVQAMADANQTIATTRSVVQTTGALTANRTLTWNGATVGDRRILDNQCTGGFAVKLAPATGNLSTTGIANGKCAVIYFDGTNWRRASPDATP
jgi:hypothetical protein